jgi:hypothetical protein
MYDMFPTGCKYQLPSLTPAGSFGPIWMVVEPSGLATAGQYGVRVRRL